MKIVELINGIQLPLTNEESDVLSRFEETALVEASQLNEREREIANRLVNKDVLLRKNQNGKIVFKRYS